MGHFKKGLLVSMNVFNMCEKAPPDNNVVNPDQCEEKSDTVSRLGYFGPLFRGESIVAILNMPLYTF